MIRNLFILSSSGEVLIEKQWMGKVKRTVCDLLWEHISRETSKADVPPCIATAKYFLIHMQKGDLTFLTAVEKDVPPAMVLEVQTLIADTLVEYFGKVTEPVVRDNFSLIYQLLDEVIDGGFPFTTEINQLKEMIVPPSIANKVMGALSSSSSSQVKDVLASAAMSKIPWRRNDVRYVSNEIFFDIIEALDVTIAADQSLVSAQVYGEIRSRCHLSHMPDVMLTFEQSHLLEDCTLHRCIRIARFKQDRAVSFVPPDGDFTLMTYRVNGIQRIPIYVRPEFVWNKESCKFTVAIGQQGHLNTPLQDVVIIVPLPAATQNSQITATAGTVRVDQVSKTCRWELKTLPKEGVPLLEGTFYFAANAQAEERPTIRVMFEMPKFSATGIKVENMSIKNVKYTPERGVRTVTKGGKFHVRTA